MTATMPLNTNPDVAPRPLVVPDPRPTAAEFGAFLADPQGYAEYDWSDPIELLEFVSGAHSRRRAATPLS